VLPQTVFPAKSPKSATTSRLRAQAGRDLGFTKLLVIATETPQVVDIDSYSQCYLG